MSGTGRAGAVLLAGGSGRRMGLDVPKQYMPLCGRPLLSYALQVLEESPCILEIVIVCEEGGRERLLKDILGVAGDAPKPPSEAHPKVTAVTEGGAERYISVCHGLRALSEDVSIAFIHDGARPFITGKLIEELYSAACRYGACAVGAPATDTIRIIDDEGYAMSTPDRRRVRLMQTPQVFSYPEILRAYEQLIAELGQEQSGSSTQPGQQVTPTDDVQVWQQYVGTPVRIIDGESTNIKLTTPADIAVAQAYLEGLGKRPGGGR